MSINTTMFEMSDDKKEQLGQRIHTEDRPSMRAEHVFCWHCKSQASLGFRITRETFFNMREEGLIPDGDEDYTPCGPFLFCHNGCAVEFFWRRYQLARLRGDLKRKSRSNAGDPLYYLPDGTVAPVKSDPKSKPIGVVIGEAGPGRVLASLDGTIVEMNEF